MAFDGKSLAILVLVSFIVYILFFAPKNSPFSLEISGAPINGDDEVVEHHLETKRQPKQMKMSGESVDSPTPPSDAVTATENFVPEVPSGALLPKEVPVSDDFGQFSTEAILSGQNYLDPRAQIGYPETVGGTLRNANLQIRSEPSNPRDPLSIWNLSTIVPDKMRPQFELEQDKEFA
jgi:hypothetical protein